MNRMKELELEDRQYEIDKELNEIGQIPGNYNIPMHVHCGSDQSIMPQFW